MRFLIALLIFHHHYYTNPQIEQFGVFPVAFFFMLSGFLMSMGYAKKIAAPDFSYWKFVHRRIVRIVPLNVIGLALAMVVPIGIDIAHHSFRPEIWGMLIPDLFLIQSWIPIKTVYFSGNAVAWFLSDMLFCYLMFPIICKVLQRSMKPCVVILVLYFIVVSYIPENQVHAFVYINPAFRVIDFTLGGCLYMLFSVGGSCIGRVRKMSVVNKTFIELLAFTFALSSLVLYPYITPRFSYASLYWVPSAVVIGVLTVMAENGGGISRILETRWLVYLGSLSFAFYIFHTTIIRLCKIIEVHFIPALTDYSVIGGSVCVVITVITAYLYNQHVEPFVIKKINTNW